MRFRRELVALILILGMGALFWATGMKREFARSEEVAVPPVAATAGFFDIPWGISRTEVLALAQARQLEPTPQGFGDYRGSSLLYNISFAGYPAVISFHFRELINTDYSFFYRGSLSLSRRNCPALEQVYGQLHRELTERYGPTPELGYPPLRNSSAEKPWGPGAGAVWEAEGPDGQLFEIQLELNLADTGHLRLTYRNISVERRFKNLVHPTPDGDPARAATNLKGFRDIPWGATPSECRQKMEASGFSFLKEHDSPRERTAYYEFGHGTYGGYPVESVSAHFRQGAMYMVSVNIRGEESNNGEAVYNKLKGFLAERYGVPQEEENFRQEQVFLWRFPLQGFKPNHIMLHRDRSLVMVQYRNQALEEKLNNL